MDIPVYGLCVGVVKEAFSTRKKRCLINWFMNRIGLLRGVYQHFSGEIFNLGIGIPLQTPVLHIKVGFKGVYMARTCSPDD